MDNVQHFEIPAKNISAAKEFYEKTFGWKINDSGIEGMQYFLAMTTETDDNKMPINAGAINGALMTDDSVDYPLIVITVGSIDATLEKVKQNGGNVILEKQKVLDMGFYARIRDIEGNALGIFERVGKS